jgi:hypothetical protein
LMARSVITRITCDQCGCLCKDGMFVTVDVQTHAEEPEQVLLCVLCVQKAVNGLLAQMLQSWRIEWLARIRRTPGV